MQWFKDVFSHLEVQVATDPARQLHRWDFKPEVAQIHLEKLQPESFSAS